MVDETCLRCCTGISSAPTQALLCAASSTRGSPVAETRFHDFAWRASRLQPALQRAQLGSLPPGPREACSPGPRADHGRLPLRSGQQGRKRHRSALSGDRDPARPTHRRPRRERAGERGRRVRVEHRALVRIDPRLLGTIELDRGWHLQHRVPHTEPLEPHRHAAPTNAELRTSRSGIHPSKVSPVARIAPPAATAQSPPGSRGSSTITPRNCPRAQITPR